MRRPVRLLPALLLAAGLMVWSGGLGQRDQRLPNGKSQREEILKEDHRKSLRDAAEIVRLGEELQSELEKNDYHVLAIASLKKAEEIEKLARNIRSRLRRF